MRVEEVVEGILEYDTCLWSRIRAEAKEQKGRKGERKEEEEIELWLVAGVQMNGWRLCFGSSGWTNEPDSWSSLDKVCESFVRRFFNKPPRLGMETGEMGMGENGSFFLSYFLGGWRGREKRRWKNRRGRINDRGGEPKMIEEKKRGKRRRRWIRDYRVYLQ